MNKQIGLLLVSAVTMSTFAYVAQADVAGGPDKDACVMMHGCAEHNRKEAQSVTTLVTTVDAARKSNDAKKMHEALDIAYKSLTEIKDDTGKNATTFDHVHDQIDKIESQASKVKSEQKKLDSLIHGAGLDVPFIIN